MAQRKQQEENSIEGQESLGNGKSKSYIGIESHAKPVKIQA
jgi:hypothetical protein